VYRFGLTLFFSANLIFEFWTVFSKRMLDVELAVWAVGGWWVEAAGEADWANRIAA